MNEHIQTERLIKTRYRVFLPARCPTCGAPVASIFNHVDRECSTEDERPTLEYDVMWPRAPGYEVLRKAVEPLLDGANLEHVTVLADYAGGTNYVHSDMFVDDEGVLKRLPRNEIATTIYRRNWLLQHPGTDPESIPFIAGPAILFDRRVWF